MVDTKEITPSAIVVAYTTVGHAPGATVIDATSLVMLQRIAGAHILPTRIVSNLSKTSDSSRVTTKGAFSVELKVISRRIVPN